MVPWMAWRQVIPNNTSTRSKAPPGGPGARGGGSEGHPGPVVDSKRLWGVLVMTRCRSSSGSGSLHGPSAWDKNQDRTMIKRNQTSSAPTRRSPRSSDARFHRRCRRVIGSLGARRSATPARQQIDIVHSGRHIHDMRRIVVSVLAMALVFAGLAAGTAESASLPKRGDHSAKVLKLERALHKNHSLKKKQVNRTFGKATTKALRKYQKAERLRLTGKADAQTWNKLFTPKLREDASLPERESFCQVLKLERALHKNHVLKKKHVNRTFKEATTKALRKYQKRERLRVTGKVNAETWKRLFPAKPKPKPKPVPPPKPKPPTAEHLVPGRRALRLWPARSASPENAMASF